MDPDEKGKGDTYLNANRWKEKKKKEESAKARDKQTTMERAQYHTFSIPKQHSQIATTPSMPRAYVW